MYGVLDLKDHAVETADTVAARIREALGHIDPQRLVVAPDCGMKYLPLEVAYAKLAAMVAGRDIVRAEIAGR
jgi:5-methyltetrahydropteroyltriglutamate--homocysteine methyltransferase